MTANISAMVPWDHGARINHQIAVPASATPPMPHAQEFWTTDETARYLRCEPQTIRKNLSTKGSFHGLKPRRFGRRWYFKTAEVRALLEVV